MKFIVILILTLFALNQSSRLKSKVNISFIILSVTHNVHGSVTTPIVRPYVTLYVSLRNATHPALNLRTQYVMSNVRNLNAKSSVQIKDVKDLTVPNVSLYVNSHIVSPTVKRPNLNANLSAKNPIVTGNVISQTALNPNVN